MFISSASVDDNETFVEREYGADDLTSSVVADLVRSLDGYRHTLVTLSPGGEAHMAIGGDANRGMVVYLTSDNTIFYNLHTASPRSTGMVSLVAGGQPGEYDSRAVVTVEEALAAAIRYAETGERSNQLHWDTQQPG